MTVLWGHDSAEPGSDLVTDEALPVPSRARDPVPTATIPVRGAERSLAKFIVYPTQPNDEKGQSQNESHLHAETGEPTIQHNDMELPQPSDPASNSSIRYTIEPSKQEVLDKSYKVRKWDYKRFFRVGRVFSTLWSEGVGGASNIQDPFVNEIVFGERVHSTIRRFVVVRQHDRFCTCLPIASYRPSTRPSRLSDYGIVYGQKSPKPIEGITKRPIHLELAKGIGPLRDTLVNYARIHTVETNVKVKDVGELDSESKRMLLNNFHETFTCFDDEEQGAPEETHFDFHRTSGANVTPRVIDPVASDCSEPENDHMGFQDSIHNLAENLVSKNLLPPASGRPLLAEANVEGVAKSDIDSTKDVIGNGLSQRLMDPQTEWSIDQKRSITAANELSDLGADSWDNHNLTGMMDPPKQLDSRFSIVGKPLRFFKIGRVFKTLWTEPAGGTAKDMDANFYSQVIYGELAFSKVRRFIVIRERNHSCLCLPMYTYSGQGTAKSDIRAQDHAIAYPEDQEPPVPLVEEKIDKDPFPIIVEEPAEKIDSMTRINFGQIFTIQHNLKVAKVGRIPKTHLEILDRYFVESIVGRPSRQLEDATESVETALAHAAVKSTSNLRLHCNHAMDPTGATSLIRGL